MNTLQERKYSVAPMSANIRCVPQVHAAVHTIKALVDRLTSLLHELLQPESSGSKRHKMHDNYVTERACASMKPFVTLHMDRLQAYMLPATLHMCIGRQTCTGVIAVQSLPFSKSVTLAS